MCRSQDNQLRKLKAPFLIHGYARKTLSQSPHIQGMPSPESNDRLCSMSEQLLAYATGLQMGNDAVN